jgi:hypothetical protein
VGILWKLHIHSAPLWLAELARGNGAVQGQIKISQSLLFLLRLNHFL